MDYKYVEDASFYETYDRALEANNSNDNGVEEFIINYLQQSSSIYNFHIVFPFGLVGLVFGFYYH